MLKKIKGFATAVGYLPANIFSGMVNLVLGSTQIDEYGQVQKNDGLLGLALEGVKFLGRSAADFIADHKKAIAVAAWLSLAAAGAVALTLSLWPAALAAVASFSVYGFSIAGIVGTNTVLQTAFAAGLVAAAVSAGTYLTAAIANTVSAIQSFFKGFNRDHENAGNDPSYTDSDDDFDYTNKANLYSKLLKRANSSDLEIDEEPAHYVAPFKVLRTTSVPTDEPAPTTSPRASK